MVSAIGSPPTAGAAPLPGAATAGVEAQLVRLRKELSDCVNCESANTTAGKAAIAAAASKVSMAESRIENLGTPGQSNLPAEAGTAAAHALFSRAPEAALTYGSAVGIESRTALASPAASAGVFVDLFA